MNLELLETPCTVALAITAYAAWRARRLARSLRLDRDGTPRQVWRQTEGKVTSITLMDDSVTICYQFEVDGASLEGYHRVRLEVAEPYQFGSRTADLTMAAEKYFAAFPAGAAAAVRYNPKRLSESVLTRPAGDATPLPASGCELAQ